jgi:ribonucleoside-diphosphate reductase alpha chain
MELNQQILSDLIVYMKYSRYLPERKRRETWPEICDRYKAMMIDKYAKLRDEIDHWMQYVYDRKVLPSMRAMQFAGGAIARNNSRIYNCAYLPVDDIRAFSETLFLLLGGTGVGYSVQYHHVEKLPPIKKAVKNRKWLIGDSLEGWADAVKVLLKGYFGLSEYLPDFDYSDIRPKGARLVTAGGKAPGPEPLKICIAHVQAILDRKGQGDKLTPLECHDIMCHLANAVLAGGIRRSAMISLYSEIGGSLMNNAAAPTIQSCCRGKQRHAKNFISSGRKYNSPAQENPVSTLLMISTGEQIHVVRLRCVHFSFATCAR